MWPQSKVTSELLKSLMPRPSRRYIKSGGSSQWLFLKYLFNKFYLLSRFLKNKAHPTLISSRKPSLLESELWYKYIYIFFLFSGHLPSSGPFSTLRSGQVEILREGPWLCYLVLAAYPTLAISSWRPSPSAMRNYLFSSLDFPGGSDGKSICLQCGRPGFDPWVRKIPLEKEMATHSRTLAWKIPWMDEGAW